MIPALGFDPSSCPIPGAEGFSRIEGSGANGVLILGEALGDHELFEGGLPFRPNAPAGSILERAIRKLGYYRDSFMLWNAIPTHPPGNNLQGPWFPEALRWGQWHLEQVVRKYRPRAILALGNVPFMAATGLSGTGFNIGLVQGYTWPSLWPHCTVIPSFHPAFLRRGAMSHFGMLLRDIGLALDVAKRGLEPCEAPIHDLPGYITHPEVDDARRFAAQVEYDPERYLAYDIETPWSRTATEEESEDDGERDESDRRIESIQFSLGSGTGIFMPWREPFIGIARHILAQHNPKMGWNTWRFDDPRLLANGLVINGDNHDLMWAWHHLQPDLPRSLQFAAKLLGWTFPWKHLVSSRPEFYGIVDCDVLQTVRERLFRSLRDSGVWRGYERHILRLEPIVGRMSKRGMPVDEERYNEVRMELACRVDGGSIELQKKIPLECKKIKVFKKTPRNLDGKVQIDGQWCRIEPWKVSNQSLTKYCNFKRYELPLHYKTKKITFDQLHLKRLYAKTRDPIFEEILDFKEAHTVLANHIVNWQPDRSGRVHSTFYYDPATGQLSSRRPNIQNAPKHKHETADLFRSMIKAKPGHTLLEFDFHGFHALMMGFEARDLDFIRLVRIDIHSFVTAHFKKEPGYEKAWSMPDDELREYLAMVKKKHKWDRDAKIKHAVLGYNNGMGWWKLYETYKEYFESRNEAKRVNAMLDGLFPICAKFRKDVRVRAHEQGYLLSRHGYIRRFFEVMKWTPDGLVPGGEQAEQAVSFLSSNDAFGEIKDRMLDLEEVGALDRYEFINTVHDSLLFECPDSLVGECIETVQPIMEAPSRVLIDPVVAPKGLVCDVGVSAGRSWEKMGELK